MKGCYAMANRQKRKYKRICGICGCVFCQEDGFRDDKSCTGWVCEECYLSMDLECWIGDE